MRSKGGNPELNASPFTAGDLNLRLHFDPQFPHSRLIKSFQPTQRFVENPQLVLAPVRDTNDGAKFALVIRRSRCTNLFGNQLINRYHYRRYPTLLDAACEDAHRLMTKSRCRYQK